MRFLLFLGAILLGSIQFTFAQSSSPNSDRMIFLNDCISSLKGNPAVDATYYCTCMYNNISSQMTPSEAAVFQKIFNSNLTEQQAMDFLSKEPKLMEMIKSCLSGGRPANETTVEKKGFSEKDIASLKKIYMNTCEAEMKNDKTLPKTFSSKPYCSCVWDRIVGSEQGVMLMLKMDEPKNRALLEEFTKACLAP